MVDNRSSVIINDVFEELNENNRRLFHELVFAKKCIEVLTEFKSFVDLISIQFVDSLDSQIWNRFEELSERADKICNVRKLDIKSNDGSFSTEDRETQTIDPKTVEDVVEEVGLTLEDNTEVHSVRESDVTKDNTLTDDNVIEVDNKSSSRSFSTEGRETQTIDPKTVEDVVEEVDLSLDDNTEVDSVRESEDIEDDTSRNYNVEEVDLTIDDNTEVYSVRESDFRKDDTSSDDDFEEVDLTSSHRSDVQTVGLLDKSIQVGEDDSSSEEELPANKYTCVHPKCQFTTDYSFNFKKHLELHKKCKLKGKSAEKSQLRTTKIVLATDSEDNDCVEIVDDNTSVTKKRRKVEESDQLDNNSRELRSKRKPEVPKKKIIVCNQQNCNFKTSKKSKLKQHLKFHQKNQSEEEPEKETDVRPETNTSEDKSSDEVIANELNSNDDNNSQEVVNENVDTERDNSEEQVIESKKKYTCDYPECQYKTKKKNRLTKHSKTHLKNNSEETNNFSSNKKVLSVLNSSSVCGFCGESIKSDDYREHLKTHLKECLSSDGQRFVCNVKGCDYIKDKLHPKLFVGHINGHKGVKPFNCGYCQKQFASEKSLSGHHYQQHDVTDEPLVCTINDCNKRFHTKAKLSQHQNSCHLKEKKYVCEHANCQFRAINASALKNHMMIHTDSRPFACDVEGCQQRFILKSTLKIHKKIHDKHNTEHYKCHYEGCHKWFYSHRQYIGHRGGSHNEKVFACEWPGCEYSTNLRTNLDRHLLSHSSVLKFGCLWPHCGKRFKTIQSFRMHQKRHINDRSYSCEWPGCKYMAYQPAELRNHMVSHSDTRNVTCHWPECGKRFKLKMNLRQHMRSHTKHYRCSVADCQYRSGHQRYFKNHMKTHIK